jgi:hypothetical protein
VLAIPCRVASWSWIVAACCLLTSLSAGCQPDQPDQSRPPASPPVGEDTKARPKSKATLLEPSGPRIRLEAGQKPAAVELVGLSQEELKALSKLGAKDERWVKIFPLYVVVDDREVSPPPVLGSYRVVENTVRFEPRFPLTPGVRYRSVFRADAIPERTGPKRKAIESVLLLPKKKLLPSTVVAQVYPTSEVLPENQLKFYLHFSAPMSRGNVYRHIHLLDDKGKEIKWAFLELGEELWDPQGKRFTLLFDPGRIKRGLKPREELGPALEAGKRYTLVIDRQWQDARGVPLQKSHRKTFRAVTADRTPPDPAVWKLTPPAAASAEPLQVRFPDPMEHALLYRLLVVEDEEGKFVPGSIQVSDHEKSWFFKPSQPWRAGKYFLVADTRLEDLAGNRIGRPFEVDVFDKVTKKLESRTVKVAFEVKPRQKSEE